jgi:hypothetical protein
LVLLAFMLAEAEAERSQKGNLIVSLNGSISPRTLPRHRPVPVAVHLSGRVLTADHSQLPRVNWIKLELGWRGALDTHELPVCPRVRLIDSDSHQALERCRGSRVGRGSLFARVFVPNQPFGVRARLTAFNGRTRAGCPAVLVHAYSVRPPASFVIPFKVHRNAATSRTVLVALIRRSVGPWPRVANFQISISRSFGHLGERRSYLKASCPVPSTFTAGFLSFARATYSFADGREVKVAAVRSCRAR